MNNKVVKQLEDLPITDEKNSDLLPTSESHLDTQNQSFFSTICSFSCFLQVYLPKMTRFTRQRAKGAEKFGKRVKNAKSAHFDIFREKLV